MPPDALRAVRARIEAGWTQGANARDPSGTEVAITSEDAISWTLCSALALVAKDGIPMDELPQAVRAISEVTGMTSMRAWNDDKGRTKQQVIDAIDDAIKRVEGADGLA